MKWILLAWLIGCLSGPIILKAQQGEPKFKSLSSREGLSSSRAWSLAQDQHGFIWIGTYDGLNVYNGYEFKTYRHLEGDAGSLSHNYVFLLLFDKKDRLWAVTPQGIDRYDAEKDCFIHFNPSGNSENKYANIIWIYEDQQNMIWAGAYDGIRFFNETTQQFEKSSLFTEAGIPERITAFMQDKTGQYWLGTEEGLYTYTPDKKSHTIYQHDTNEPASLAHNTIKLLFEDSRGNIWIGTSGGVDQFVPHDNSFKHISHYFDDPNSLIFNGVRSIEEDHDGNLWIGAYDGGLHKFDVSSQTFTSFVRDPKNPYSLTDNAVKDIMVDETGGVWIATFRGVSFTDHYQMQFDHLQHKAYDPYSLTDNYVTTLFKDSEENIWAGNRFGISLFNPEQNRFTHYVHDPADQESIADGAVLNISEDAEGNLWGITHTNILNKFDRKKKIFYRYEADPEDSGSIQERSNFVHCTQDGNVWVSFPEGISVYNQEPDNFSHYFIPDSIQTGAISYLYEDSRKNLLVVSWGAIYVFDRQKKTFSLSQIIPKELIPFQTTHIYEDSNNNVWIGSAYQGLISYHPEQDTLKFYTNNGDLPDIYIKGILEDRAGNLWLSSNNGLCRFNPHSGQYRVYGLADGLRNSEFNLRACVQSADGKMYFGGHMGISVFCPELILNNPNPPQVVITNFQLFNKTVSIGKDSPLKKPITETTHIDLDYKQSVVSFEFVGLNYNSPEKNQYAYRMLGFEDDWNYAGTRRHVTYTNLPPGKTYTFQVKASNNDGVWNEAGTAIELYIKPPFWATWWFYSFLVCFAIGSLYGLYRWRTWQHYLHRKELERMVQERTEEVEAQKEALTAHAGHLKTANREITLKNKKILRQANKLKALDQLKSQFLANISHEFRTPLTLILVPLEEMLSAVQGNGDTKAQLAVMNRNARRLLQLINQLLDLSKLENGSIPLALSSKNIVSFIKSVAQSFDSLAQKHKIDYQFSCTEVEIVTSFDADKLEKIMCNLLSNAFKFTPEGGSIKISVQSLELTGSTDEPVKQQRHLQCTVSDTGSGISAEHLPHIFDRFYQAEPSLVRKSDGTGIGLALTKELVELHGGTIKADSQPGQGTCFTILLPLTEEAPENFSHPEVKALHLEVQDAEEVMEAEDHVSSVLPDVKHLPLLLIVEDNEELRQQIKRIFSGQFRVEEAADGEEGWQKASETMPDFIISDVMMPGKDGLTLCNQLKNDPATSHIPTILLSARIDGVEAGLRVGADDYITKPFNAKMLALKVKNLLDTRQRFREAVCRELGVHPAAVSPEHGAINPQDQQFIAEASEIALKHLTNTQFDMEIFYRELGMSRTLVYKKLKSLTGLGPNEFIRRIRLNKASELLLQGKHTIAEVMYEAGFNHRSYFVKCFKNEFGHLPSEHASFHEYAAAPSEE